MAKRAQIITLLPCALLSALFAMNAAGAQVVTDTAAPARIDTIPTVVSSASAGSRSNFASMTADIGALTTIGSVADDRHRLDQILGREDSRGYLLRSASSLTGPPAEEGPRVEALMASFGSVWNTGLPFSQNDGLMWAGRGLSWRLSAGMRLEYGPLSLIFAPEIAYQENGDFQTILYNRATGDGGRHQLSSPWYDRPASIDMPTRFGGRSYVAGGLGQSSLSLAFGPLAAGAATENLWWGPGVRNAILLSNHAAGIPHLFLRTGRPLRTAAGDFEGRWMLGRLSESEYFDDTSANDTRSFSAVAVTFRPAFERDLTVGFARAVYAAAAGNSVSLAAAFDVFRDVGRPNDTPVSDRVREPGADQLFSVFGRWIFPRAGFETYAEWARYEQPSSLRDLLVLPHHSQGYTLGLQWARPVSDSSVVRLQGELTYLEPSATFEQRNLVSWYTSRPVRQGYTQKGQVIGAGIGPGASSQWLAVDFLPDSDSQIGAFAGRIRWDNHAFYSTGFHPFFGHDVSLYAGIRGSYRIRGMDVSAELATEGRMNYLYQSPSPDWEAQEAVDLRNHSLRISVTPRLH